MHRLWLEVEHRRLHYAARSTHLHAPSKGWCSRGGKDVDHRGVACEQLYNVCLLLTGSKYRHRVSQARITTVLGCADAEASGS